MDNTTLKSHRLAALAQARQARHQQNHSSVVTTEKSAQNRLSHLGPAQRAKVKQRLLQMPKTCRGTYLRAVEGNSPKSAIKAFCLECVAWQRAEVTQCTALACPLWSYRPFQPERKLKLTTTPDCRK